MLKLTRITSVVFILYFFGDLSKAATVLMERTGNLLPDYDINRWPYVVSVQNNDTHVCVGCILEGMAILTSSKCVRNVNPKDLTIEMSSSKWAKGEEHRIAQSIYDINGLHEDLAILFLENPVEGLKFNRVIMGSYKRYYGGNVFHWSASNKMCAGTILTGRIYVPKELPGTFTGTTFPAEVCSGEVGSPLILTYRGGDPLFTGILTDKSQCSDMGFKNIFIDVGFYKEQIKSIINFYREEIEELKKVESIPQETFEEKEKAAPAIPEENIKPTMVSEKKDDKEEREEEEVKVKVQEEKEQDKNEEDKESEAIPEENIQPAMVSEVKDDKEERKEKEEEVKVQEEKDQDKNEEDKESEEKTESNLDQENNEENNEKPESVTVVEKGEESGGNAESLSNSNETTTSDIFQETQIETTEKPEEEETLSKVPILPKQDDYVDEYYEGEEDEFFLVDKLVYN